MNTRQCSLAIRRLRVELEARTSATLIRLVGPCFSYSHSGAWLHHKVPGWRSLMQELRIMSAGPHKLNLLLLLPKNDERPSMSYMSKFVAALVGLLVMAIVASRQLFLFAVFKAPPGLISTQGGTAHLWLAFSAGITACIAGGLMFHFFLLHERNKWSKVPMAPIGPLLTAIRKNPSTNSPTRSPLDSIRWALANPWLSEGQADDRRPMDGSVADSGGTPSTQRTFARRSHQLMFKNGRKPGTTDIA